MKQPSIGWSGALLLEQNDEWALQRRYMTLETLAEIGDNPNISLTGNLARVPWHYLKQLECRGAQKEEG